MTSEGATVRVEPDGRPTAVELAHFSARPDEAHEGTVAIRWKTATEIDNAGFNVYRYPVEAGTTATPERINETLIPADGDGVTGADYVWSDTPGYGTYHYWLEDVEFDGTSTMHPWVTEPFPRTWRSLTWRVRFLYGFPRLRAGTTL